MMITAGELVAQLQEMDPDAVVMVPDMVSDEGGVNFLEPAKARLVRPVRVHRIPPVPGSLLKDDGDGVVLCFDSMYGLECSHVETFGDSYDGVYIHVW